MSNKRIFAIVQEDLSLTKNLISRLLELDPTSEIYVFGTKDLKTKNVIFQEIPSTEIHIAQNQIINSLRSKSGFLHVFRSNLDLNPEKFRVFVDEIEQFMDVFKYDIWANTVTDECNYVFTKWVSRFDVAIDDQDLAKKFKNTVRWMSNANLNYMVYNLGLLDQSKEIFDQRFSYPMFSILKFFSERRGSRPGSFMNLYPTIESEKGILKILDLSKKPKQENLKIDQEMFKNLNLDLSPTTNIELVLEFMVEQLRSNN